MEQTYSIDEFWETLERPPPSRPIRPKPKREKKPEAKEDKEGEAPPTWEACNCRRNTCSTLYCACKKAGRACTSLCRCIMCTNCGEGACVPSPAKSGYIRIYPGACRCRKSRCLKKYCVCFAAGIECTSNCRCSNCENCEHKA